MPRAPFQVLVYPYYQDGEQIEYAIFRRQDNGIWQTVAGGGEDNETPPEAARREAYEEAGLPLSSRLLRLDTVEPIPAVEFKAHRRWGEQVYVIPQYCFGIQADTKELRLCDEHQEYRWMRYAEAMRLIHYDGNRTALWELECRLRGRRLPYDDGRLPVQGLGAGGVAPANGLPEAANQPGSADKLGGAGGTGSAGETGGANSPGGANKPGADSPINANQTSRGRVAFLYAQEVMFFAHNRREAAGWYSRFFQAPLVWPDPQQPDWFELDVGGQTVFIHQASEKMAPGAAGQVVYWRVSDFQAALQHALSLEARLYRGPLERQDGTWMCQVRDPFGNLIGIIGP